MSMLSIYAKFLHLTIGPIVIAIHFGCSFEGDFVKTRVEEADDAIKDVEKHVPRVEANDSLRKLQATQSVGKPAESTKTKKKPVQMQLDFSHLRSALDAISNRNNTWSTTLEEQQNTPMQNRSHPTIQVTMRQPEISSRNPVDQTVPEKNATELKRKIEAMRNRSHPTIQVTFQH
ncbi:hypothetical protein PIB30_085571 [Stylosanthes scabra]|uniref:Uncharacterized protein n=1 Tax=Stylosanthes scabra TaxID=79078 RepID=A0ABU6VS17_9FABA|nr:hypothetical protein [Stylosanthes scabra]